MTTKAIVEAISAVTRPTMATTNSGSASYAANSGKARATRNTPATTMVAAWIRALTGVGPSIASGSQTWKGTCADFPMAPRNRSTAAIVVTVSLMAPVCTASKASSMLKLPTSRQMSRMPTKSPTSPMRVTINAFLAASRAEGSSCQNPINR